MKNVIHLALTSALVAFGACNAEGCKPWAPSASDLDKLYSAEIAACVAGSDSLQESCTCRLSVDTRWGLCSNPTWQPIGRCGVNCEALK